MEKPQPLDLLKRRCVMPTYEFLCEKCQKTFTVIISISEYEKKDYQCPQCKNKDVKQQISSFQAVTSKKS
jgi:putative FmdB family regulatory protein